MGHGVTRRRFVGMTAGVGLELAAGRLSAGPAGTRAAGEPNAWSLKQAAEALRAGRISSLELTEACLERIARYEGKVNAFITVTREAALEQARAADRERSSGRDRGLLHGVPIALKDNIDTAGVRTSAASALFADRIPTEDAEVVRRLTAAGAVSVGKLNLHEFAFGGTSVVSFYGPVHNPWNLAHSAGGSSGGSGAAIAADMCFAALGTDTGGSIRIPASWCGVVGLKPTYGRVSNRGVIPLCWSLDHVGPLTRTVEDAAIVLQALAGYDALDTSSADVPVSDYASAIGQATRGLRVGLVRAAFFDNLDPEVESCVAEALRVMSGLVAQVRDVQVPSVMTLPDALYGVEIHAYHAQFFPRSASNYQLATRRSLEGAAKASAADYAAALQQVLRLRREIARVFAEVDLLLTPAAPAPAWTIEEALKKEDSEKPLPPEMWTHWQFNVFGLPTISVPCGFTKAGLPVGLQISGPAFGEVPMLALAHAYEQATPWRARKPRLEA